MVLELLQEVFRVICNFQEFVGDGAPLKTLRFVIVLTRESGSGIRNRTREKLFILAWIYLKKCARRKDKLRKNAGIKVIKRTREEDGLH